MFFVEPRRQPVINFSQSVSEEKHEPNRIIVKFAFRLVPFIMPRVKLAEHMAHLRFTNTDYNYFSEHSGRRIYFFSAILVFHEINDPASVTRTWSLSTRSVIFLSLDQTSSHFPTFAVSISGLHRSLYVKRVLTQVSQSFLIHLNYTVRWNLSGSECSLKYI